MKYGLKQARTAVHSRLLFMCICCFFKKNKKNILPPLFKVNGGLILLSDQDRRSWGHPPQQRYEICQMLRWLNRPKLPYYSGQDPAETKKVFRLPAVFAATKLTERKRKSTVLEELTS